jgi:FixJ family two-component response regulator
VFISVVDDDESVRESLPDLLRSFGFEACAFASAEAFLASSVMVDAAIEKCRSLFGGQLNLRALRQNYDSLGKREREVMALVPSGFLNKQVGGKLGISEITVKAHRGQVMRKMRARSFAELVNIAARLGVGEP